jgi:transcription elongation GreA/GreB family factor
MNQEHAQNVPEATIGSVVTVKEHGADEEEVYRLGEVTRPRENQVAPGDAMGQALLGAHPGDEVIVHGPVGPLRFDVIEVQAAASGGG